MLLDDDNEILEHSGAQFIKEIQKELEPLIGVVGNEIKAAGMTVYRSLTLVYYDGRPSFVAVNFGQDWVYDTKLTEKENVNQVIRLMLNKIIESGICSDWSKLSVYQNNSYLSKRTK